MSSALKDNIDLPEAPYRGAEPFRYIDHPIFFARKEETRKLLRQIIIYRGVLLYGDSGAGKSSLINAGLMPEAREEGFTPDRIRLKAKQGAEVVVERISIKDNGEPPYLPSTLVNEQGGQASVDLSLNEFRRKLEDIKKSSQNGPESAYPLLIFDQFEEFVTLFEEAPPRDELEAALKIQSSILQVLTELLLDESLPIKLLFVFREDYFAKIARLFVRCPELTGQSLRLTPPGIKALRDIIRKPFEEPNLKKHFKKEISESLARGIAQQILGRNKGNYINLSEVQIVCRELWQSEEDMDELFKRKTVQELLEDYLTRSLKSLDTKLQGPAVALLGGMVTPYGKRNVISEYNLIQQLNEAEDIPEAQIKNALDALVNEARLVRREYYGDANYYEIISEFLIPRITSQTKERQRQQAERQLAARRSEFVARERRIKRLSSIIVSLALLLLLISGVSSYLVLTMRTKDRIVRDISAQLENIEVQKARADQYASTLLEEKNRVEQEKDVALELKARAERERDDALQKQAAATRYMQLKVRGNQNRRLGMFGSTMLEIAIGLILIYLILSLVCTMLHEIISSFLHLRERYLETGIITMLGDIKYVSALYSHPLINALDLRKAGDSYRRVGKLSYIPSDIFALALLDVVSPPSAVGHKQVPELRQSIAGMPDGDLRRSLLVLIDDVENDIFRVRANIERWYESAMDRVSGYYRRRTQYMLLALAFVLTLLMNVNTLTVANRISHDAALRETLVAQSQALAQQAPAASDKESPVERINENLAAVESLGLPIGWSSSIYQSIVSSPRSMLSNLLGWLLTAIIVSLGAPVCFDVLNKFSVIRSTIKPYERSFEPLSPPARFVEDEMAESSKY